MESFKYRPLISIIIPVYNTSKYLEQCLDSVISQDYADIEIICINDCSTDDSLEILKKYFKKDNRMILLNNEKNLGAGLSRNRGVEIAKGEYIFFVDSDDWLETNACSQLIKILNLHEKVDFISFKLKYIDAKTGKVRFDPAIPSDLENIIVNIFSNPECIEHTQYSVTKLLNADFIRNNNILYKKYNSLEDVEHTVDILLNAKKIIFSNILIYNYREHRKGSVVSMCDYYTNVIIDAVEKANLASKNFPTNIRNKLLAKLYRTLLYSAYISYYHHILSFTEFKSIYENSIDINVLKEENLSFYVDLYRKITRYSSLHFRIITTFKLFIKESLPFVYNTYMNLKNRIKKNAQS